MYSQVWSGPRQAFSSRKALGQPATLQCCHKQVLSRHVSQKWRQTSQQQSLLLTAAAAQHGSRASAAAAPEQQDVTEDVAVSTMDALLTVMDEGTGSQEEQLSADSSGETLEQGVVMLEETADFSEEEENPYTPEDAVRWVCGKHAWILCSKSHDGHNSEA